MSEKRKFPADAAIKVAKELVDELRPFTVETPEAMKPHWPHSHLFAVAGSLRRRKPVVGDIELLFVPKTEKRNQDFFEEKEFDLFWERLTQMIDAGRLARRLNVAGVATWGPLNKHGIHVASGIPVDFFATTVENFFVSLVIRTGSKETNLKLTTGANAQMATLNAYGSGVTWADGTSTAAISEQHVFEMCRVPYLDPWKR
ncbi:MAG TPA: hypothetical protein VFU31_19305 [Candidatus Binatia bacterium]|nr:hypothetical protein [Candidatus Binatia bacterium]